jgi:hypothetical protein
VSAFGFGLGGRERRKTAQGEDSQSGRNSLHPKKLSVLFRMGDSQVQLTH